MPYPGDSADCGQTKAEAGNLNAADEQNARYFVDNADLDNPGGTRVIARILNHFAAMVLYLFEQAGVAAIPRSKEQLVNAINALIANANSAVTVSSITAGLIAVRTETYRPGYLAGANYNLPDNDNDQGQFNGQQWQVIDENGILGDRFVWRNGAGVGAAAQRNAGRWHILGGAAVQIWTRGAAASGAGSAGQLANIPANYRRYIGNGSENARQHSFAAFRRLYFHFSTTNTANTHQDQTSPAVISAAAFIAGERVNASNGQASANIQYSTASTFAEYAESGEIFLKEIWAEF